MPTTVFSHPTRAERLQWAFNGLMDIFDRLGLRTNVRKTAIMIYQTYHYQGGHTEDAYNQHMMGESQTYQACLKHQV